MLPAALTETEDTLHIQEGQSDRPATRLIAFAEAIEAARGDLAGTLVSLTQSLPTRDRRELLYEMLARERENPGAFLSGALAGFVIGRSGADLRSLSDDTVADESHVNELDAAEPLRPGPEDPVNDPSS